MYNQLAVSATRRSGKALLFVAVVFSLVSIADAMDIPADPNLWPDFNGDKIVNFADFATFADNWQKSGDNLDGDFDESGAVDANDLATLGRSSSGKRLWSLQERFGSG